MIEEPDDDSESDDDAPYCLWTGEIDESDPYCAVYCPYRIECKQIAEKKKESRDEPT